MTRNFPGALAVMVLMAMVAGRGMAAGGGSTQTQPVAAPEAVAAKVAVALQARLDQLSKNLEAAAAELSLAGISGPGAETALDKLYQTGAPLLDCSIVGPTGILTTIVPKDYADLAGIDISSQGQVLLLIATKKPVLSGLFRSVEGTTCFTYDYPILSPDGSKLLGSISLLFQPENFFPPIVGSLASENPSLRIKVLQKDGWILFDSNPTGAGKNAFGFTDVKTSPAMRDVLKRITREAKGSEQTKRSGKEGKSEVVSVAWDSAGIDASRWRIVVYHVSH